jgi:transcriptional regulator with XRE-family HTH domain
MTLPIAGRLAGRVRDLRQHNGWSRASLADMAGLHATTVWNVERGQGAHVATVDALARALGVTPGALLDEERP